ncbi:MAG: S41 family peptidase [Steroidobacteraceae bacterium]
MGVLKSWRSALSALGGVLALAPYALSNAGAAAAAGRTLMRFPTLYDRTVVFEAHGNLWAVPRTGGVARRLTADSGYDLMPRFSPDGRWIAFTAEYQGNQDVYAIPAGGGTARRLTFHSDIVPQAPTRWGPSNMVVTWTRDSKDVVFLSRRMSMNLAPRLFEIPVSGGLATPLPLDSGGLMTFSPDGRSIAYNRIFRNFRTWKRYQGGWAQDVYTYQLAAKKLTRITNWKGTDTAPMWYGHRIYFLSDRDARRRRNIWAYDLDSRQFHEVTHFVDYDIDFPSLSPAEDTPNAGAAGIVFQQGGSLWVLDLPSEQLHRLEVSVPDDGVRTGPRFVDASKLIREHDTAQQTDYGLSPNGKRALFSARGDLFTVPAEHGATRNLTETSNADEDHPSWSPDGKTIAYTTDSTGEQEIATRPAMGGPQRILTRFRTGFFYTPVWSPDGKHLAFADGEHRLWLLDIASGRTTQVAEDPYNEIHDQSFSPDGRWLAYSTTGANQQRSISIYSLESGRSQRVSEPLANDFGPVFSPDGRYLVFVSSRHENPTLSESEFDVATLETSGIYIATLRKNEPSPFAPRSDEGAIEPQTAQKSGPWKPGASAPVQIDFDGLMARAVPVPIPAADIVALDARGENIFYQIGAPQMLEGPLPRSPSALRVYDLAARKDGLVVENVDDYSLSADGEKVLYKSHGGSYQIVDAKASPGKPSPLDLAHLRTRIRPTQEWAQMFNNAWRLERDLFVIPQMNGVDWQKVHDAYAKLLPLLGSREDLNYLIGEVQGELGNSHTYIGGGDDGNLAPRVPTALLGVDLSLDRGSGRYRFAKIYPGDNTRPEYRSPLTEPGVDVHAGDYLLAVDGRELAAPTNPYSLFVGLENQPVTLTVAASPSGRQREVTVQPLANERALRERDWIDHNRETVDRLSGGRIGYIYLSDMEALGMEQFVRQFYPQLDRRALIVDDRWNGGGFIDQIVLARLRRMLVGMTTDRQRARMTIPQQISTGPKVCLINHMSASDGDLFPYFFRKYGVGPLIGTRTWGGVRGIRGTWALLDGGYITVPEMSVYGIDSQWVIENHGVDPDIEVETDPGQLEAGHDAQLEAAVDYLMKQLAKQPGGLPAPPRPLPAYPPNGQVPPLGF